MAVERVAQSGNYSNIRYAKSYYLCIEWTQIIYCRGKSRIYETFLLFVFLFLFALREHIGYVHAKTNMFMQNKQNIKTRITKKSPVNARTTIVAIGLK